jgi:L-fuculose-phosphate aldolase
METGGIYEGYAYEREELAYFMRRLYQSGLTTCSGGNLSMRTVSGHFLITPSALDKGRITAEQIGLLAPDGTNLTPELKSSIETGMHVAVYGARPDITAIVHVHPITATSFTAMRRPINTKWTAEAYAVLGVPVMAGYALMGSQELAKIVAEAIAKANVVLMRNHGVIAVGPTLLKAFDRVEVLEAAAKMTVIIEGLADASPIPPAGIAELDAWMAAKSGKKACRGDGE